MALNWQIGACEFPVPIQQIHTYLVHPRKGAAAARQINGTAVPLKGMIPRVFELQVKTLFEHAWSEAEHDLGYKPGEQPLTPDQTHRLAYTSAQAWGADRMFDELFRARSAQADQPAA